ncbi:aminotransferase-like domain-containing protein [Subtercola frigoramans]|uniref:DNA-binding transcriptional MocR family regulator n=1 Tax=Subtercola frigoramans TaxID=120298 RepID=A0ABS2L029_9MICO|nr:PLP-dependent aminotransferase family protein [Subtercola frigoramans]MBM7470441.1 DNA-binding transcriptional MocR family regulator [Subtercola frigoramans]
MTALRLSARALENLLGEWRIGSATTYVALADRIRLLSLDGRIPGGSRLPAERELAARLSLSRSTIGAAYAHLRESGYVESIRGSGSVTRYQPPATTHAGFHIGLGDDVDGDFDGDFTEGFSSESGTGFADDASDEFDHITAAFVSGEADSLPPTGIDSHRDRRAGQNAPLPAFDSMLNFTQAALPAAREVSEALQLAAGEIGPFLKTTGFEPFGLPALRQAIADRYGERGLPTHPDEILVTSGALSGLSLIARTLVSRGDRAIIESPTYPHAADALAAAGARLVPVAVTVGEGWDEDAFIQALARTAPTVAYIMPDFHNPTGETMSNDFRRRLVDAAQRAGTVLIADETTAELNIDRADNDSFAPLAVFGDAIMLGSAAKTLWGGLRIGWIRAPRTMIRRLLGTRAFTDIGTPLLEQLAATHLIRQTASILPERQKVLRAGRDLVRDTLAVTLPDWQLPVISGGLCLWAKMPRAASSQLVLNLRARGILMNAGPRFGIDGAFERFLRIPTSYSPADTHRALDALQHTWHDLNGRPLAPELPSFAEMV